MPLASYVKLRVVHALGMSGTFSPPTRHVPGLLTGGFLWSRWRGRRSRHSRGMRNPQFYVSGKRPISIVAVQAGQQGRISPVNTHTSIIFLRIILKSGKRIYSPKISDYGNSASLNIRIMDRLISRSVMCHYSKFGRYVNSCVPCVVRKKNIMVTATRCGHSTYYAWERSGGQNPVCLGFVFIIGGFVFSKLHVAMSLIINCH